jgi:hypothetical protein
LINDWKTTNGIIELNSLLTNRHLAYKDNKQLVVPPDDSIKREILHINHDAPAAGHLGRDQTYDAIACWYWWPGMRKWIAQYVKECGACQQNKVLTHRSKVPLYQINVPPEALPFQVIAMDLITQLPKCDGFDAILTIVDHGCTWAAVFIPCTTTITGEGVAKLYFDHIYRWFGLPE